MKNKVLYSAKNERVGSVKDRRFEIKILLGSTVTLETFLSGGEGPSMASDQISCSVVSDSLRPRKSQHAGPPCPSPTLRVHSDSCPSSQ